MNDQKLHARKEIKGLESRFKKIELCLIWWNDLRLWLPSPLTPLTFYIPPKETRWKKQQFNAEQQKAGIIWKTTENRNTTLAISHSHSFKYSHLGQEHKMRKQNLHTHTQKKNAPQNKWRSFELCEKPVQVFICLRK